MKTLAAAGRVFFALAMIAFGIEHLIYASTGSGLGPPWTPANHVVVWVTGAVFMVAGVGLAAGWQVPVATSIPGLLFLARAAIYYFPGIAASPRNPGPWTSAFEIIAMCGACVVATKTRTAYGRFLFAASLVVFGIQHLIYGPFIAGLIPVWIPGRLFWAWFVGFAFLAAALAIAANRLVSLAATLLGAMFLLWVLILHAPRVAGAPHNGDEWTSMFVALAMSGGAFMIAGTARREYIRRYATSVG